MSNRPARSDAPEEEAQNENSKDAGSHNKSSVASQKMAATGDVPSSSNSISTSIPPPASPAASPSIAQPTASALHLPPSSAASATSTPASQSAGKLGNFLRKGNKASPQVTAMNTINSTASEDYVSDGRPSHPRPPHPMFHSLHEDSDGSDGSIVFNNKRKKTQREQGSQEPGRGRERFPSFDSMASSGSLVRHGPQHSNNLPSPQAPKVVTQQNLTKVNPQMLPYDQRRKLMKMKQQQQKSQPRQKSPPRASRRAAPAQPPPDGRYVPYMMPPPEFPQQNPYVVVNGMPMSAPPHSSQAFMYPMQPPHMQPPHMQPPHMQQHQHVPPNMPGPYGPYPGAPPPPNARLSPYRSGAASPRIDPNRPPAPQAAMRQGSGGRARQYAPQQHQQHFPPNHPVHQQQQQQQPRPLPPSGVGRQQQQQQQQQRDPRSAHPVSLGSVDQDPRARYSKNSSHVSSTTEPSQKDSNSSGPPPPPPPPPPHHVRTESTGSVSSLGSQGSIFGYIGGSKDEDGSKKQSFLQMLNPFSPKTQEQKSPQQAESDFRRQSQDFLLKQQAATARRLTRQASPRQGHHQRVGSMDRPPTSRGTHKRLPSIENDNWEEPIPPHNYGIDRVTSSDHSSRGHDSPSSHFSSSEETDDDRAFGRGVNSGDANERTSLLPPPGQGSSEYLEHSRSNRYSESHRSNRRRQKQKSSRKNQRGHLSDSRQRENETTDRRMNTGGHAGIMDNSSENRRPSQRKQKKQNSKRRRPRRSRNAKSDDGSQSSTGSHHSSSSSSYDYRQWTRRRAQMLEDERTRLIAQWKAEARAEALNSHRQRETNQWHRRLAQYLESELGEFWEKIVKFMTFLEAFICNMPSTVGAIAMAIVTLGVCWFKFVEEALDTCEPVQFHSSQCTFPEFPGCFYCDTTAPLYRWAVNFHFGCSSVAGILALSFVLKMLLATQVVLDEMSSPTTASPAGLICMTSVCVFAGRGFLGQIIVSGAACVHLCLVIWFIYMALAYHIMPDPSWFPNTVGIGMSAVKIWLYYPMSGHFLMAISLSLNFFFFPISLIRVVMNEKISATVGYMQMSAPAISLYALTIMAQPSFEQEKPDINRFQRAHRLVYLPAMHFLFVLSVIGFMASVQSLLVRLKDFKKRGFSPAHAAFCFPTLLHANAIQAYRAAINSFSAVPLGSAWKTALDTYWLIVLVGGSVATLWISAMFFYNLPSWTNIPVEGEEEPPAPYETSISLQNVIATGESLVQPFVSPAVLQANETGALIMVRRARGDTRQRFVRTRKVASLGFEPTMDLSEMERERDLLLEWVGKHPPRRRNRTLSVPGIDFSYGTDFGVGNSGIYNHVENTEQPNIGIPPSRGRTQMNSPYRGERSFF